MARALLLGALLVTGCSGNPYQIGRLDGADAALSDGATSQPDAALGECTEAHRSALLCTGFEATALDAEWSSVDHTEQAQVTRTSMLTHGGEGALHASSAAPESYAQVAADLPAQRSGALYLRAYVYVPPRLPTETMNVAFLGDGSESNPFQGVDLNLEQGALELYSPQSSERYTDAQAAPRGRWFCLRLELSIDDSEGRARLLVDERLALETEAFDTRPDAGVTQLRLGIDWSSDQAAFFEIYIDDVVLDTQPVACKT